MIFKFFYFIFKFKFKLNNIEYFFNFFFLNLHANLSKYLHIFFKLTFYIIINVDIFFN